MPAKKTDTAKKIAPSRADKPVKSKTTATAKSASKEKPSTAKRSVRATKTAVAVSAPPPAQSPQSISPVPPAVAPSIPELLIPQTVIPVSEPSAPATSKPIEPSKEKSKPADDKILHFKPPIIIRDLAARMSVKPFQLISDLMQMKILVSINQPVEPEVARKLCDKYGFKLELERRGEPAVKPSETPREKIAAPQTSRKPGKQVARAPVVTIMGHVDHGKTSLLDAIRKTNIVSGEDGGITQHIGAYSVTLPSDGKEMPSKTITFLDTPGHEAFTAMRARGANITDLVVLVVAASEGLMPQTIEAIHHAKAANVPILVALTKMDLEAAQKMKDRVKKQLQEHDLTAEDWGGKTITVEISAIKKTGIDTLLEMIMLQAEMMELKAETDCLAEGNVIEAQMEAGRGPTATILVRRGTLRLGDSFIVGPYWGKAKALIDDRGRNLKEAGPSTPVKIVGLSGVPDAGIAVQVMESESEAREHSESKQADLRSEKLEGPKRLTIEDLLTRTADNRKGLNIILKADAQGSLEAIRETLSKLPQDKIHVDIIHTAVGSISKTDIDLARASKALIVGFHVRVDNVASEAAVREGVQIQLFRIIYELVDKVREFMAGLLDPEIKLSSVGTAEVKQVFEISKGGNVAGCLVIQGRIERKGRVRILRRRNVIFEGGISTLRRFQDDVSDVRTGLECGIRLEGFNDYEPGDIIEVYHLEKILQKL